MREWTRTRLGGVVWVWEIKKQRKKIKKEIEKA